MSNKLIRTVLLTNLETGSREQIIGIDIAVVGLLQNNLVSYAATNFTIAPYQKYFLFPGTSIPRVKLQNLSIENGIKTVRNIDEADVCFYSSHTLTRMSDTDYHYAVPKAQFELAVEEAKQNGTDDYILNRIAAALTIIEADVISCDWNTKNFLTSGSPKLKDLWLNRNPEMSTSYIRDRYTVIESDFCELVDKILAGNVNLVHEKELLANLNGDDALVITSVEFDQITNMFKSSDKDNHVLAMEIMANCNYQDSIYYLLRAFKDFHNEISQQRAKNHVNFKSLLSFLNIGKASYNWSLTGMQIVNLLKDKKLLTLELIDRIIRDYTDEIKHYSSADYHPIRIKSFTLSDELLEYFNVNYTNTVINDFEPTIVESAVEEAIEEELTPPTNDQEFIWS